MPDIDRKNLWCIALAVGSALCVWGYLTLQSIEFEDGGLRAGLVIASYYDSTDLLMIRLARWRSAATWAMTIGTALGVFAATQLLRRRDGAPEGGSDHSLRDSGTSRPDSRTPRAAQSALGPPPLPLPGRYDDGPPGSIAAR